MPNLISPIPKENPISEKIRKLAEMIPGASWLLPDSYDPSSYLMPVGGLTKVGKSVGSRVFDLIFKQSPSGKVVPTSEFFSSASPEKLKSFLTYIEKEYPNPTPGQQLQFPKHLIESVGDVRSSERRLLDAIFKDWNAGGK